MERATSGSASLSVSYSDESTSMSIGTWPPIEGFGILSVLAVAVVAAILLTVEVAVGLGFLTIRLRVMVLVRMGPGLARFRLKLLSHTDSVILRASRANESSRFLQFLIQINHLFCLSGPFDPREYVRGVDQNLTSACCGEYLLVRVFCLVTFHYEYTLARHSTHDAEHDAYMYCRSRLCTS